MIHVSSVLATSYTTFSCKARKYTCILENSLRVLYPADVFNNLVISWKYCITVTGFIDTAILPFPSLLAHIECLMLLITAALKERMVQKAVQAILNASNKNATDL